LYYKLIAESATERIGKIDEHRAKLQSACKVDCITCSISLGIVQLKDEELTRDPNTPTAINYARRLLAYNTPFATLHDSASVDIDYFKLKLLVRIHNLTMSTILAISIRRLWLQVLALNWSNFN